MSEDKVVPSARKTKSDDPLTEILRAGAKRLIEQAVEAEFSAFLCSRPLWKLPDRRQRVVRHGHRSGSSDPDGELGQSRWKAQGARSRGFERRGAHPLFVVDSCRNGRGRTKSLDVLFALLSARHFNRRFQEVLTALLGKDAPNLSPAVSRG